jgi:hypothetical protein
VSHSAARLLRGGDKLLTKLLNILAHLVENSMYFVVKGAVNSIRNNGYRLPLLVVYPLITAWREAFLKKALSGSLYVQMCLLLLEYCKTKRQKFSLQQLVLKKQIRLIY